MCDLAITKTGTRTPTPFFTNTNSSRPSRELHLLFTLTAPDKKIGTG